jgi:DNA-binding beta-propeller fold protein YncE
MRLRITVLMATIAAALGCSGQVDQTARPGAEVVTPGRSIVLPGVEGRIDHMACDPAAERLYIAALGNGSLEVVDLAKGEQVKSVRGLKEPQGVAFIAAQKTVAVACGGDGTLRLFDAATLEEKAHASAGEDADNVRLDEKAGVLWVGVGDGAVAGFEASTLQKKGEVPLRGHPESFQLDPAGPRLFVNVPSGFVGGGGMLAAGDRDTGKVTKTVELKDAGRNFPMALDSPNKRLYVGCRRPACLLVMDSETLAVVGKTECIGDADEVFVDGGRVYAVGGDGAIDVFETKGAALTRVASVKTESGARTGLLVPERHALYVAVPARSGHAAEVREYRLAAAEEKPSERSKP